MEWVKLFSSGAEAHQALTDTKPQLFTIRGQRICLLRRDNKIFAFQDDCTHSRESLSKGRINYLGEIICPGHGYCFSPKTGRESSQRSDDLEIYPTREDEVGFYIGI
jgi:3-phenylpropionate/trans-cinnamate dioxygenase ferredoxin subunit